MKYIVDESVLIAVVRGNRTVIEQLHWHRKWELGTPQPVVLAVDALVKDLRLRGATKRWHLLLPDLPRLSWTDGVTDRLLGYARSDLDAITVAHALELDAHIVTIDPGRYSWADGLRVEELAP
jgi:predicted nucleic acid-binding protein